MPSTLITTDELRNFIGEFISPENLDRILTVEDAWLQRMRGPHGASLDDTLEFYRSIGLNSGVTRRLWLPRPARQIDSIVEYFDLESEGITVDPNDYSLVEQGKVIERRAGFYGPRVKVVYRPQQDLDVRKGTLISLVQSRISYEAASKANRPDELTLGFERARQAILQTNMPERIRIG